MPRATSALLSPARFKCRFVEIKDHFRWCGCHGDFGVRDIRQSRHALAKLFAQ